MTNPNIQPELQDIMEMIRRYIAVNKQGVCFVGGFLAVTDKGTCPEDFVKEDASRMIAYGPKEVLRSILNDLRDEVEDSADEDGFLNF